MKIREVKAFEVDFGQLRARHGGGRGDRGQGPSYAWEGLEPASPMARYREYKGRRSSWSPKWKSTVCVVTAADGTFGLGISGLAGPVVRIINDHFAPRIEGENCMATEKIFDMMSRLVTPFGSHGLASFAISAVDLALWDLKGKIEERPVYELLGGPQKERIPCYATGFDYAWYLELGFSAVKLPMPYGPVDGTEGLAKAEEMVAAVRDHIGPRVDLMLDCWMALDVDYTVRLAEALRPYRLRWIEDFLMPEEMDGFAEVRGRLPWQTLATGEHWYMPQTFWHAATKRRVGRHFAARSVVGGRNLRLRAHLSPRGGGRPGGHSARRHEQSLRPASLLCDAGDYLGRTFGRRFTAGRSAERDRLAARDRGDRRRLPRPQRRAGFRLGIGRGLA